jgi:pimeloyl-ACP methyl ester carboxylesterase
VEILQLDHPVFCCWSYGLSLLDYIRHYGADRIAGIHLVSAISKLGSEDALSVVTPEALRVVPGLFSTDAADTARNLETFLRMFFARPPSTEEIYLMLGYNVVVPPHVRQAMFSRTVDNDDVLRRMRKPALITHGTADAVVKLDVVERHKALLTHAEIDIMPNVGHAPFREDAQAFNGRLRAFVESL